MRDRAARAAGAQQQHDPLVRLGQGPPQAFAESPVVRVVADPAAVPQQHRVHGADLACGIGEVVHQRHDGALVRMRDVQAVEAFGLQLVEDVGDILGKLARLRVDQAVVVGKPHRLGGGHVHARRA